MTAKRRLMGFAASGDGAAHNYGSGEYRVKVTMRTKEGFEVVASASFTSSEAR